jgi:hypothetical protein
VAEPIIDARRASIATSSVQRLFKYLPDRYAETLLDGRILFRNLVYFKRIELDPRSDMFEGVHIDAPDHDVTIDNLTTGRRTVGRFAFHNTLAHMERVFCFCTSLQQSPELLKFGNTCVEIRDAPVLAERLERALRQRHALTPLDTPLLIGKQVTYYASNQASPDSVDIKNPQHLPFLKRNRYQNEQEFRYVFARRGGYTLKQMLVLPGHNQLEQITGKPDRETIIDIGSIRDIAQRVKL